MENKHSLPVNIFPLDDNTVQQYQAFSKLMAYYRCAMMEIETKMNVLNVE